MLTKILFTLAVIIGVVMFYRTKQAAARPATTSAPAAESAEKSLSPRTLAYILIGLLVVVSAGVFVTNWQSGNRIVTIRVIADNGTGTTYQTRHKTIKGRSFVTLEGTRVTLGESDRIEMMDPE